MRLRAKAPNLSFPSKTRRHRSGQVVSSSLSAQVQAWILARFRQPNFARLAILTTDQIGVGACQNALRHLRRSLASRTARKRTVEAKIQTGRLPTGRESGLERATAGSKEPSYARRMLHYILEVATQEFAEFGEQRREQILRNRSDSSSNFSETLETA